MRKNHLEGANNVRVKLPSRMVSQNSKRFLLRAPSTIRTICYHCVESVCHEDDARTDWYLSNLKTTRITGPIAMLVVMSNNFGGVGK